MLEKLKTLFMFIILTRVKIYTLYVYNCIFAQKLCKKAKKFIRIVRVQALIKDNIITESRL